MEVTHINHLDTHAIIGGGEVQTFSTKQDAEFFEIMSSTLYSHKKLAVIREVLCNSWDANIESGKENKPVLVEITDAKMTFKDFGPGIPKEKMGEIYCTYGGSTKRHDGKKTGGFGLGSKAPFAYAKNFTVTTVHGGIKSVFNISRGTSATEGVPDLRCMVSVPSTEASGVTVSIPIQQQDRAEFEALVKDIAYMGGMIVKLNNQTLRRVNYETDMPFVMVPVSMLPRHLSAKKDERAVRRVQQSDIRYFVKYGAVVYPIPEDFTANRHIVVETGAQLVRSRNLAVVFIAPPDSIGVTPSRETLSMTDKTIDTLKALFSASNNTVKKVLPTVIEALVPRFQKKILGHLNFSETSTDNLIAMVKSPLQGYILWCSAVKGRDADVLPDAVVNTEELLTKHLIFEYEVAGWGHKQVAEILFKADPDGKYMLSQVRKHLKKRIPLYGNKLFWDVLSGKTTQKREHHYKFYYLKKVARLCKYLEADGVSVAVELSGWDNDRYDADRLFREIAENKTSSYYGGRLTSIIERLLIESEITHIGEVPIMLAQSQASIDRVVKAKVDVRKMTRANITVIARKKKDYERLKQLLTVTMNMKNVILIPDHDLLIKPTPQIKEQYLLYYGGREGKQAMSRVRTDEDCKYYIFTPGQYLIPGVEGVKLNQKKIDLDPVLGRMLCYLYPNLILVPGIADANELEHKGIRNVFEVLAEEVEAYFKDPRNHEILLNNLTDVRGYFRSYALSAVLRFITPAGLLEILGKKPVYVSDDREIPSLIHTFFFILGKNYAPKYGFQYVQKAADRTQNIFDFFFGDEVRKIVDDPLMSVIINHLPSAHDTLKPEAKSILSSAVAAAMQTTILHQHLRKKAPK